ncbi:hypothetical protein FRB95_001216 [Tulasnella sp. JGI-2019a]|nr:hypothetical protein FRB95_001216 [Tulasnella sp. JGI-2019a]
MVRFPFAHLKPLGQSQPMTSNPLPLPLELIPMVMDHLHPRDVSSALQTCHAMRTIVEPCLYKHISIPTHHRRNHTRMAKLLRTLYTRPDLTHYILTFNGSFSPVPHIDSPPSGLNRWLLNQLRHARTLSGMITTLIHHMVNVRSLTLQDFDWLETASQTLISNALCSTTSFASLTALAIEGHNFFQPGKTGDYTSQLSLILRSQPRLERLELRSGDWDLEHWILQSDVPSLSHLMAQPSEAPVMVCGRPIRSLFIRNVLTVPTSDIWEAVARSEALIDTLTLEVIQYKDLTPTLYSASMYMKDVQKLVIHGAACQELPLLISGFPSFHYLQTLRVMVWDYWDGGKISVNGERTNEEERIDATIFLRSRCPRLQNLEINQI